jgi:hypothetical protein
MRRISPLLLFKLFVCRLGFGDRLVEFCECCGRQPRAVWWAPPELWTEITGHGADGAYCELCFEKAAIAKGVMLRWVPRVAHRLVDGRWSSDAPPDPELFPIAARYHSEEQKRAAS